MTELFDSYGKTYGATVQSSIDFSGLQHDFFLRAKADFLRALIARQLPSMTKPAILDVGCGVGSLHPFLHDIAGSLNGIDVSEASLAQARVNNPQVNYQIFDGRFIPYHEASFDLAIAVCVLHHVAPNQWLEFTREMRRVVRPGGLVCIIEHNPLNPLTRLAVMRCAFDKDAILLGARQTRRLLVQNGLREVGVQYFLLLPSTASPARAIETAVGRLPLGAQYAAWGVA